MEQRRQLPRPRQQRREKARVEAFSDAVFAIAVTLLVLELRVPPAAEVHDGQALATALLHEWPSYAAYLLSFGTILIMWVNHHVLLDHMTQVDHAFLYLNGLLLLSITLVPFPTRLVAEHAGNPGGHVAAAVYCGLFTLIAIFFNAVWRYAAAGGRLIAGTGAEQAINWRYLFGPLVYFAAFVVSFFSVALSLVICAALALFFALPYRPRGMEV